MNWKSILAAMAVTLSPLTATAAVTINIYTESETCSSDTGTFLGTCNNIAFNVVGIARDDVPLGRLESRVVVTELFALGSASVEIISDYNSLRAEPFMNILSYAEVLDIVGIEPVLNPDRGGVEVAHFITPDGEAEMTLADFAFGGLTGERQDVDTIQNGTPYQLRSLFTFEADERGAASVLGDIVVRPSSSPAPIPIPRPPSSFATSIPTMPLYALIASVIGLLLVGIRRLK